MSAVSLDSVEQQASYGVGLQLGQQLNESGLDGLDTDAVLRGLSDALSDQAPAISIDVIHKALRQMYSKAEEKRKEQFKHLSEAGEQYLANNRKVEGVKITESGLQFRVLKEGSGKIPTKNDTVKVHYTGHLIDGKIFDSSVERGQPAEFPVNAVIPGWTEALMMMPVGSKWQIVLPADLAYGERGAGSAIPPHSTLIFDVELLDIVNS